MLSNATQQQIEIVRQSLASAYPESITDTLGRVHPCVPRNAILRGDWDGSQMFRDQIAKLDTIPDNPPDTQGERQ